MTLAAARTALAVAHPLWRFPPRSDRIVIVTPEPPSAGMMSAVDRSVPWRVDWWTQTEWDERAKRNGAKT